MSQVQEFDLKKDNRERTNTEEFITITKSKTCSTETGRGGNIIEGNVIAKEGLRKKFTYRYNESVEI